MFRSKSVFVVFALVFAFISAAPAQNTSEREIEMQVMKKVRYLPYYGVFDHITVEANGSVVTLRGKVASLSTKDMAARTAKEIAGVTEVVNQIDQLPPSSFDDRIRRAAYIEFLRRGPSQYFSDINPDVRIIVENGRITLEGYVARQADSDLLNILANGISGVFSVTNNIVVGKRIV